MSEIELKSAAIRDLNVYAYKIPADSPESDGTLKWDSTTMVLVSLKAGGETGIGYTYADSSAATLIINLMKEAVLDKDPMDIPGINLELKNRIRNNGNCGIAFMALSAVDSALWDLKAKLLHVPLFDLLGKYQDSIRVYGSGGFTSYSLEELKKQLGGWAKQGFSQLKMKIGREPGKDIERIHTAKESIGSGVTLFVDANGAYDTKQAVRLAQLFEQYGVEWYEEPVSSDNLSGLSYIREHCPAGINIAAGEYGFNITYFREMLLNHSVDILQADATRCGGITGFMEAGKLAGAFHVPFSFHCAPSLHLHAALSLPSFYTGEYFHDHVRIEKMLFEGFREAEEGRMSPDLNRPGLGLEFKFEDAEKFKIFEG